VRVGETCDGERIEGGFFWGFTEREMKTLLNPTIRRGEEKTKNSSENLMNVPTVVALWWMTGGRNRKEFSWKLNGWKHSGGPLVWKPNKLINQSVIINQLRAETAEHACIADMVEHMTWQPLIA
jgi:hypothetical protein